MKGQASFTWATGTIGCGSNAFRRCSLNSRSLRLLLAGALGLAACGVEPGSVPVNLIEGRRDSHEVLTVVPTESVRINARVAPALELSDGSVLRLENGSISADSNYFLEPPWSARPGPAALKGNLKVSYCRADEVVCRAVVLPVRLAKIDSRARAGP